MDIPSPGEELVSLSLRLKSGSFDKVKEAIEVGQAAGVEIDKFSE